MLFVMPLQGPQIGIDSWAKSAWEFTFQLHVPDQWVSIIMVSNGLVNIRRGFGLLQLMDAAVALGSSGAGQAVAVDATGPGDVDD